LAPQSSASSAPAGDSFVLLLNSASVIRFPVQPIAGAASKEQSAQSSSNGAATKQAETRPVTVQGNGSARTSTVRSLDDRDESVARETSGGQQSSNRKPVQPASLRPSISPAYCVPDSTIPIPQMPEINVPNKDLSLGQGNDQSGIEESSTGNDKSGNAPVNRASVEVAEPGHSQPAFNGAAPESIKLSQDLSASVEPLNAADPDDVSAQTEPIEPQSFTPGFVSSTDVATLPQPMPFSVLTALADKQGQTGIRGNTTQLMGSAKSAPVNQDTVNATNSGTAKAGCSSNGSGDAPIHTAQGTSAESSQNSATVQRVVDIASPHQSAQSAVSQGVSMQATSAPGIADAPGQAAHSGMMRQAADPMDADSTPAMPTSAISDAKLMQTMTESQMRIGLSSNAFGDISIRTSISGHQMVAQISLDHNELSQAISAQISTVQTKLNNEHGLQASIEINNHAPSQSGDTGNSSRREQGSPTAPLQASNEVALGVDESSVSHETIVNAVNEIRLDIRA
jgi:hypothetical protein